MDRATEDVLPGREPVRTPDLICLIDDDAIVRQVIGTILEGVGYEVVEAHDGEVGLNVVEKMQPAVVITDIVMPRQDGIEVIREIKRRFPYIPLLAISGSKWSGPIDFLTYARKLGADDCLAKPFTPGELRRRVAALCRARERLWGNVAHTPVVPALDVKV